MERGLRGRPDKEAANIPFACQGRVWRVSRALFRCSHGCLRAYLVSLYKGKEFRFDLLVTLAASTMPRRPNDPVCPRRNSPKSMTRIGPGQTIKVREDHVCVIQ